MSEFFDKDWLATRSMLETQELAAEHFRSVLRAACRSADRS